MTRRARLRALAKINLDLRVLSMRPDGFHELRTMFQTISLADRLEIAYTPGRRTCIELLDDPGIPDNLVVRAAQVAMDAMKTTGRVEMRLVKRIPMGAGLGGGSSDAAAVLLALPALARRPLSLAALSQMGETLGSDVPFFLLGGTAVGIGRGSELFPLPDAPAGPAVVIAPGIHVNTAAAYRALSPRLTSESQQNKIFSFQTHTWNPGAGELAGNDFEDVVFEEHAILARLKKELARAGASPAMMTGSGSALFGVFKDREQVNCALGRLRGVERAFRVSLVTRARYRSIWWRALREYTTPGIWPPQGRNIR